MNPSSGAYDNGPLIVNAATAYGNIMGEVVEDIITDDDGPAVNTIIDVIDRYDKWLWQMDMIERCMWYIYLSIYLSITSMYYIYVSYLSI